jgi:hypothetical protein
MFETDRREKDVALKQDDVLRAFCYKYPRNKEQVVRRKPYLLDAPPEQRWIVNYC